MHKEPRSVAIRENARTDATYSDGGNDTDSVTGSTDLLQDSRESSVINETGIDARTEPAASETDANGPDDDEHRVESSSNRREELAPAEARIHRVDADSGRADTDSERDEREAVTDPGRRGESPDQSSSDDFSVVTVKPSPVGVDGEQPRENQDSGSSDVRPAPQVSSSNGEKSSDSEVRKGQDGGSSTHSEAMPPLRTVQELPKPPDVIVEDDEKKRLSDKFRKMANENIDSMVSKAKSGGDVVRDILNPSPPTGRSETRPSSGPYLNEVPHAAPDVGGIASAALATVIFVNELIGRAMDKARKREKE